MRPRANRRGAPEQNTFFVQLWPEGEPQPKGRTRGRAATAQDGRRGGRAGEGPAPSQAGAAPPGKRRTHLDGGFFDEKRASRCATA